MQGKHEPDPTSVDRAFFMGITHPKNPGTAPDFLPFRGVLRGFLCAFAFKTESKRSSSSIDRKSRELGFLWDRLSAGISDLSLRNCPYGMRSDSLRLRFLTTKIVLS